MKRRVIRIERIAPLVALLAGLHAAESEFAAGGETSVRFDVGSASGAPGEANIVVPIRATIEGSGGLAGWTAAVAYDASRIVVSGVEFLHEPDVTTVLDPREFVDAAAGRIGLQAIYNVFDADLLRTSDNGEVCRLRFCVRPDAAPGVAAIELIPAAQTRATSVAAGADWLTACAVTDENGILNGAAHVPATTGGSLAVAGGAIVGGVCDSPDIEPPPAPRASFRLEGPDQVLAGETFSIDLHIDSDVALTAMSAAFEFDPARITVTDAAIRWRPQHDSDAGGTFRLISIDDREGTVGVIVLSLIGDVTHIPAGPQFVASLEAMPLASAIDAITTVDFVDEVHQIVDPALHDFETVDGLRIEFSFGNWATDDWGGSFLSPQISGVRVEVETAQGLAMAIHAPREFIRGDSDDDSRVALTDAVHTAQFLYANGGPPACPDAADADDSGGLDISDVIWIARYLFLGGAEPPAPGPREPGDDPTPDGLGCR